MKRDWTSRGTLVLVGLILVAVNLIALNVFGRLDLTDDKVYSLTDASRELVRDLEDPVTVTAYFTKNLPAPFSTNRRLLKDKLEEYEAFGAQNFQFRLIDPAEDEAVRQDLNRYGIPPVQVQVLEKDNVQLKNAYMGVTVQYEGEREVLPVVQDLSTIEYDLTSAIRRLSKDELPVVHFLQGHGEPVPASAMAELQRGLQRNYSVGTTTVVDDALSTTPDVLMIVAPTDTIPEPHLRAIDAYVMGGGRAGVLLNTVKADLQTGQAAAQDIGLQSLLRSYGLEVKTNLVMDERSSYISMQSRQGFFNISQQVPYAFFPLVSRFDEDNMMVNRLRDVVFYYASTVDSAAVFPEGVTYEPLLFSSDNSSTQQDFFFIQPMPDQQLRFSDGPFVLGAAISGTLPSAYEPGRRGVDTRMVVIGDGDFINESIMGPIPGNMKLALNMVDWLVQDDALLGIRAKSVAPRQLRPVSDGSRPWIRYANMLGPAILIVLFGVSRWRRRKSRQIVLSPRSTFQQSTTG